MAKFKCPLKGCTRIDEHEHGPSAYAAANQTRVRSIEFELDEIKDLVLIDRTDAVWLVVATRWWDLASLVWWWLCPSDKKARVVLRMKDDTTVSVKALRIATRHVRVRGEVKS